MVWVEILINWKHLKRVVGDGALNERSDARIEPDVELSLFYDEDDQLIAAVDETRPMPLVVVGTPVSLKQVKRIVDAMLAPQAIKTLMRRCVISDTPFRERTLAWWSGDCSDMPNSESPKLLSAAARPDVAIVQKIRKTLHWGDDDWSIQSADDLVRCIAEGADVQRYDEFVTAGVLRQVFGTRAAAPRRVRKHR